MSESDFATDGVGERARGVPPMLPGGERQSVGGWIWFGAVALAWPPLWFCGVADLPPDRVSVGMPLALSMSIGCALARWAGAPRTAWAVLAFVAVATVLWSLAIDVEERPGDPYATNYGYFIIGMMLIDVPAWLLFAYQLWRHTAAARSESDTDPAG